MDGAQPAVPQGQVGSGEELGGQQDSACPPLYPCLLKIRCAGCSSG